MTPLFILLDNTFPRSLFCVHKQSLQW